MFHTGATIPGDFPSLSESGETARYITFADIKEVEARAEELTAIAKAWIQFKA